MSDWFAFMAEAQRELLKAQQAQITAAQTLLDAGKQAVSLQEAGHKAAQANLAAWKQWSSLWGWK